MLTIRTQIAKVETMSDKGNKNLICHMCLKEIKKLSSFQKMALSVLKIDDDRQNYSRCKTCIKKYLKKFKNYKVYFSGELSEPYDPWNYLNSKK